MKAIFGIGAVHAALLLALVEPGWAQTCPTDWVNFGQSCYVFVDEFVPWTSAQVVCQVLGARMLEVETEEENAFITAEIQKRSGVLNVWLGLQDYVHEGRWVWNSNRHQPAYTNWAPGEPNNSDRYEGGEDCVQLYGATGQWDDAWCENVYDAHEKISIACEMDAIEDATIG